jgi:hypothetical protein
MNIPDPGLGFLPIPDPDFFYPSRIPDPGVKKAPDPGSATLLMIVKAILTMRALVPVIMFELPLPDPYPELILADQSIRFVLFINGSGSGSFYLYLCTVGTGTSLVSDHSSGLECGSSDRVF